MIQFNSLLVQIFLIVTAMIRHNYADDQAVPSNGATISAFESVPRSAHSTSSSFSGAHTHNDNHSYDRDELGEKPQSGDSSISEDEDPEIKDESQDSHAESEERTALKDQNNSNNNYNNNNNNRA